MAAAEQHHAEKPYDPSSQPANAADESASLSTEDDIAAKIVPDHAQYIDPEAEKRVLRKIDLYLIPFMWFGYGFVYYDKVSSLLTSIVQRTHNFRPSSAVPSSSA